MKPTTYKEDEVLISGFAPGGISVINPKFVAETKVLGKDFESIMGESALATGGLGNSVVATTETAGAGIMSVLALAAPIIAAIIAIALVIVVFIFCF